MISFKPLYCLLCLIGTAFLFSCQSGLGKERAYELNIPKGFPAPEISEDRKLTAAKVELGRHLFYDPILSRDSSTSCASCHIPQLAFTDGRIKSRGVGGLEVERNSMSLVNLAYANSLMREGSVPSLEQQVLVPIQEHNEFDYHIDSILLRLRKIPVYVKMFSAAFDTSVERFGLTQSIAAFERSIFSGNSPVDQYLFQGNQEALSEQEKEGLALFKNLNCVQCHSGHLYTNQEVRNNGLYNFYKDPGRYRLTLKNADSGFFKVPTLRNVGLTAPYMHDGSLATLDAVLRHYERGGANGKYQDSLISHFTFEPGEMESLKAFLLALSDSAFLVNTAYQNPNPPRLSP